MTLPRIMENRIVLRRSKQVAKRDEKPDFTQVGFSSVFCFYTKASFLASLCEPVGFKTL